MTQTQAISSEQATSPPPEAGDAKLFSRTLLLILLVQFASGITFATFLLLPNYLLAQRHEPPWVLGTTKGAFSFAAVVVTPLVGHWLDSWGRKRVLVVSLLVGASSYWLFGFATHPFEYIGLRCIHGAAYTMVFNAGATLTMDIAPPARRAQAIGIFGSAGMITNAIGPTLGEAIAHAFGWKWVFVLCSFWALVGLYCATKIQTPEPLSGTRASERFTYSRTLLLAYLGGLAIGFGFGVTTNYVPAILLILGATATAPIFVAFSLGAVAQRAFFGFIPDRIGTRAASFFSLSVYGIAVLALALVNAEPLFIALCLVVGIAHGMAYPAVSALTMQEVSPDCRGRTTAHLTGCFNLGLALSTAGLAPFAPFVGFRVLIACGALVVLLSAGAIGVQRKRIADSAPLTN